MIRAALRRLVMHRREWQANRRLNMDRYRLEAIRRGLAGIDDLRAELLQAEDEAVADLIESARLVRKMNNEAACAANNTMRNA